MDPVVTTKRLRKFGGTHIYTYDDQGVSNLALFQLLRSAGFELARFDITELHDRYDEFDAFTCSSFDELFSSAEWGRIGGNWLLSGVYGDCEVWLKGSNPRRAWRSTATPSTPRASPSLSKRLTQSPPTGWRSSMASSLDALETAPR